MAFFACYLAGTAAGALFPVWCGAFRAQLLTLFAHQLAGFCAAVDRQQLLAQSLCAQLPELFLMPVLGGSVFGLPCLMLYATLQGVLNGAVHTCVWTGMLAVEGKRFFISYLLPQLGRTVVLFWALWEAAGLSVRLLRACLRRQTAPELGLFWERWCLMLLAGMLWCLGTWRLSCRLFYPYA